MIKTYYHNGEYFYVINKYGKEGIKYIFYVFLLKDI